MADPVDSLYDRSILLVVLEAVVWKNPISVRPNLFGVVTTSTGGR